MVAKSGCPVFGQTQVNSGQSKGAGTPLIGRLLLVDALHWRQRTVRVRRDPDCPACGTRRITDLSDAVELCSTHGADDVFGPVPEMAPVDLSAKLAAGESLEILDVREPHEWAIARIAGARLIPLAALDQRLAELPQNREIIVHCKLGGRSAQAVRRLRAAGFTRVWNLAGGIQRWSEEVDPSVPRY
jgi:adenylyltransferase/sulfurtransferase